MVALHRRRHFVPTPRDREFYALYGGTADAVLFAESVVEAFDCVEGGTREEVDPAFEGGETAEFEEDEPRRDGEGGCHAAGGYDGGGSDREEVVSDGEEVVGEC